MSHQRHASHDAVKEPHYVSVKVLRQTSRLTTLDGPAD